MSDFDLIISGGTVATASDTFTADVGVRGGRIVALAEGLTGAAQTIDAAGRLVLPGGIDSHVHIAQPSGPGIVMADDFESATRSAAFGGNTTVMPFCIQPKGGSIREALKGYHALADGRCYVDVSFHLIISDPSPAVLGQELPALISDGYTSFKIYMTYDGLKLSDREILEVLWLARREQAMTMVHCENHDVISWLTERLQLLGRNAPKYHALSHPPVGEGEATQRAVGYAELLEVPLLVVHVSSREAVDEIRRAQSRGLRILAETCPQYLFLTADDLDLPGQEGARCICSPPPRDKTHHAAIWNGLANGTFAVFSSDHSPFGMKAPKGKFVHGADAPFWKIPNGIPGVETRLPLLLSEGVLKGRISLEQFVALTATNCARIYGVTGKGSIAIGADADIVVWNTDREVRISHEILHSAADYTPYEGMVVKAWPEVVLSRGEVVVEGGRPIASQGRGQFLRCDRPEPARAMPNPGASPVVRMN